MGEHTYVFGQFALHAGGELQRDGRPVELGNRALRILEVLVAAGGRVVTKEEIMDRVWPGLVVEDGNISVQIASLRKALGTRDSGQDWIVTVPRIGYRFSGATTASSAESVGQGREPTVAVLPFANLSPDLSQDYFADGIVADLITGLSRFKSFSVVSRSSSFTYKGKAVDVRQVGRELGVRYLLEGSVRLAEDKVRVTAQLVDASEGHHLWASNFDGKVAEVFEFQDRISESVIGRVEPQIRRTEIERSRRKWPQNPKAYDYLLRAMPHFYSNDPAGYGIALEDLERAIALEPDYATALAYASWAIVRRVTVSLKPLAPAEAAHGLHLTRLALNYGEDDPVVQAICGHSLIAAGMRSEGLAAARRARIANPNNVVVLLSAGTSNMLAGDLAEAEQCYRRAHELSPGSPEAYECLAGVGYCRLLEGRYDDALEWLEKSRASLANWPPSLWVTIAAFAHLDRLEEARSTLAHLLSFAPYTSLDGVRLIAARSDGRWDVIVSGLERAGLR
jgi:TolB-like protein/Tfp pilus assembly protein PilF